ncbi:hypothetical protein EV121DRAFT_278904 [Schizophyllum commune]
MPVNATATNWPLDADDLHVLKFIAVDTAVDLSLYGAYTRRPTLFLPLMTSARAITTLHAGGSIGASLVLHDHDCGPNGFLSRSIPLLWKIRSRYTSAATKPQHPDECDCHDQLRLERRCARLASVVLMARQSHCEGNFGFMPLRAPLIIDCALTIATLDSPFSDIHVFGSIAFHMAGIYPTCVLFVAIRGPTESLISAQVSQAMRFEGPAERLRESAVVSDSSPGGSAGVLDIGHQDSHVDSLSGSHLVGVEESVGVEN